MKNDALGLEPPTDTPAEDAAAEDVEGMWLLMLNLRWYLRLVR